MWWLALFHIVLILVSRRFDTATVPVDTFTSSLPLPTLPVPTGSSQPAVSSVSPQSSSTASSSSRQLSVGAVIGIGIACLIPFVSALILFIFLRRRKLRRDASRWKADESVLSSTAVASTQGITSPQGGQYFSGRTFENTEKGSRMQMDQIQAKIEQLRMRVAQIDVLEETRSYTSLRPSESASRLPRTPMVDPRLRDQVGELQAQIASLEEERRGWERITQ